MAPSKKLANRREETEAGGERQSLDSEVNNPGTVESGLTLSDRRDGNGNVGRKHDGNGYVGRTLEMFEKRYPNSRVGPGPPGGAYCPGPEEKDLTLGYDTLVRSIEGQQLIQEVEKTDYIKEVDFKDEPLEVPKLSVKINTVTHMEQIVVVRRVPKTRKKIVYRVVQEEIDVTEMVDVLEYIDVPRIEEEPYYNIDYVKKRVSVPVLREKPVTTTVKVPTGEYCRETVLKNYTLNTFNDGTEPNLFDKLRLENRSASGDLDDAGDTDGFSTFTDSQRQVVPV